MSLTAIFNAAQRVNKWQLVHGEKLQLGCSSDMVARLICTRIVPPPPTMVSSEATCVLAGDCCHSLPPFLAQGLNLGLEDAATLGHLLSHVASPTQLPKALSLYDRLRTNRAEKLLEETSAQIDKLRELQEHSDEEPIDSSSTVHDWYVPSPERSRDNINQNIR